MKKPAVSIFGLGRLGSALDHAFKEAGYSIQSTYGKGEFPLSVNDLGDLVLLTVPDSKIKEVYNEIIKRFPSFDRMIIHCSGTLSSNELMLSTKKMIKIASFHPLKAITSQTKSFKDSWFDLEGDADAVKVLAKITEDFKANSFEVDPEAKIQLHAAAVVSSNYLVTMMKMAVYIANKANIDYKVALEILTPLAKSSLDNISEMGLEDSLTGPISRGDFKTVQKHLEVLKTVPEICVLYKSLGLYTLNIATGLDSDTKQKFEILFRK